MNVFEISKMPVKFYLDNCEKVTKLIRRDLITTIYESDDKVTHLAFYNQMCKMPKTLIKHAVGKVDTYLSLVDFDESVKLDYQNAQTKIKRELDQ